MGDCEIPRTVREFKRILKQDGWLILMENRACLGEIDLQTPGSSETEDPFTTEMMPFYYPSGCWEKKEFCYRILMDREEFPDFLSGFFHSDVANRAQQILRQVHGEELEISGKTVLHIGQPGF